MDEIALINPPNPPIDGTPPHVCRPRTRFLAQLFSTKNVQLSQLFSTKNVHLSQLFSTKNVQLSQLFSTKNVQFSHQNVQLSGMLAIDLTPRKVHLSGHSWEPAGKKSFVWQNSTFESSPTLKSECVLKKKIIGETYLVFQLAKSFQVVWHCQPVQLLAALLRSCQRVIVVIVVNSEFTSSGASGNRSGWSVYNWPHNSTKSLQLVLSHYTDIYSGFTFGWSWDDYMTKMLVVAS